jgi:hypothetical protein
MAVFLNNLVGLKINSVDLSNHVKSATITRQFDELETTTMGATGHTFVKGLENSTLQVEFLNDTAGSSVLQTLQQYWGSVVGFTMVQTTTSAVSATNPLYSGNILVNHTTDINGTVADLSTQSITFTISGATAVATTGTF